MKVEIKTIDNVVKSIISKVLDDSNYNDVCYKKDRDYFKNLLKELSGTDLTALKNSYESAVVYFNRNSKLFAEKDKNKSCDYAKIKNVFLDCYNLIKEEIDTKVCEILNKNMWDYSHIFFLSSFMF